ncbi:helix-turn-helix transcriptional regulator [Rathayibacter soli]|uniref:helix-turn-helix transcriptional regulator n=1 Tax=Rathayibacter soli TaxID=3144168 RepID=UPI0027E4D4CD|nr:helix-turn-helix transcriptional regulator [Glaciibacter superstes]
MDREQLADFLRKRREALQPEDVGLSRGPRRRTSGLRREEVASLSGMSTDYYSRLEQRRGPQPSEQMVAAIARGLHLTRDERDHLFRLAGHPAPARVGMSDHVSPGMLRIFDRLTDTPALVINDIGETLLQTPLAIALLGDQRGYTGLNRSTVYRWFMDASSRSIYPETDHPLRARTFVADLRAAYSRAGSRSRVGDIVNELLRVSPEFSVIWSQHEVAVKGTQVKRIQHQELGILELSCQTLSDPDQGLFLLVFTATPGSESAQKLQLLAVIGSQTWDGARPRT